MRTGIALAVMVAAAFAWAAVAEAAGLAAQVAP